MKRHYDDDLLSTNPEEDKYICRQQNPYAKLSIAIPDSNPQKSGVTVAQPALGKKTVSKECFKAESGRILGFYVPAIERKLRANYKAFIARNLERSPAARSKVLSGLQKYDLSDVGGLQSRFNREQEDVTEDKLRKIERDADKED